MASVSVVSKPLKAFAIPFEDCRSLINAVASGNLDAVKRNIPGIYNVNQRFITDYNETQTYLGFLAILYNQPDILQYLITQQFDMCVKDTKGLNVFMVAANTDYLSTSIIDMLFLSVYESVDWNEQFENRENNTLLHMAILRKNNYLLHKLLSFNNTYIKVASLRNIYGDSAISLAIKLQMDDISLLLCKSLKPEHEEGWYHVLDHKGDNLLTLAKKHNMEQVFALLDKLKSNEIDEDISMRTDTRESNVSNSNSSGLDDLIQKISDLTVEDRAIELKVYQEKFASTQNKLEEMEREYNEVVKNLLLSRKTNTTLIAANAEHERTINKLVLDLKQLEEEIKIIEVEKGHLVEEHQKCLTEIEDLSDRYRTLIKKYNGLQDVLKTQEEHYTNIVQEDKSRVDNLLQVLKEKEDKVKQSELECDLLKWELMGCKNKALTLEKDFEKYIVEYQKIQRWLSLFQEREKEFTLKENQWETTRREWDYEVEVWTKKEKEMQRKIEFLSQTKKVVSETPHEKEMISKLQEIIKKKSTELEERDQEIEKHKWFIESQNTKCQENDRFILKLQDSLKEYITIEEESKKQKIKLQELMVELNVSQDQYQDLLNKHNTLEEKYYGLISTNDTLSGTLSSLNGSMSDVYNKLEVAEENNTVLEKQLSATTKGFEKQKNEYLRTIANLKEEVTHKEEEYNNIKTFLESEKKRLQLYITETQEGCKTTVQDLKDEHDNTISVLKSLHNDKLQAQQREHKQHLDELHNDYIKALTESDKRHESKFRDMEQTLQKTIDHLYSKTDQLEEENKRLTEQKQ